MIDILHAAFAYLDEGYAVFPCDRQSKRPLVKWSPYQHRLPTKLEWQGWWARWQDCNLGLVTGYYHNRVVLDFDTEREFHHWSAQDERFTLHAMVVKTGRGYHVHFETHEPPGRSFTAKAEGGYSVEVKARGNFVVMPPSIHTNGQVYRLVGQHNTPLVIKRIDDVLGPFKRSVGTKADLRNAPGVPIPTDNGRMSKVQAIKTTFRIASFIQNSKNTPDGRGRVAANCPLPSHDDKHMSFWYHPQEQVCACAKCTEQGTWDVINLYAQIYGLTNRGAIEELYQLTPQGLREER